MMNQDKECLDRIIIMTNKRMKERIEDEKRN